MRKPVSTFIALALCAASLATADSAPYSLNPGTPDDSFASELERAVVVELNLARTDPAGYAAKIEEQRRRISGKLMTMPDGTLMALVEGAKAWDEAIAALKKQKPLPPFAFSAGMSRAARDHAEEQSRTGATGHYGKSGSSPFDRMNKYGSWSGSAGENVAYGPTDAVAIVVGLLVDDGVAGRGHRKNILSSSFKVVGVGIASHPAYGLVCVMDFAGAYAEKK